MEDKLELYLDELVEAVKNGTPTAVAEAQEIADQYIQFYIVDCWLGIGFGMFLLFCALLFGFIFYKYKEEEIGLASAVFGFVSFLFAIICIPVNIYNLVRVTVAPKIVLFEKLTEML